jgi:hypothetical protein
MVDRNDQTEEAREPPRARRGGMGKASRSSAPAISPGGLGGALTTGKRNKRSKKPPPG